MNSRNTAWLKPILIVAIFSLLLISCKDDDKPKLIPEVTTAPVTDITTNTAIGGGEIVNNGNDAILKSGLCWSNSSSTPTISDSKIELTISEGSFTSKMEWLASGTTIYVRAYASNSIGTGYGKVMSFMTGNAAPIATGVVIVGTAEVNKQLTASYTYGDVEGDAEAGTTFQWYRAQDGSGTGEAAIAGATSSKYDLQDIDEFKYIRFGIIPKSATGNQIGVETKSPFVGPIAVRTTITFSYNGTQVTYGIITSAVSGKKWLDRNLGAPNAPSAYNDFANYGDLFQWGRKDDGHQLIVRAAATGDTKALNETTTTLSTTNVPNHSLFIVSQNSPYDWRTIRNDDLWQPATKINNPCPTGWKVPSESEWDEENLSTIQDGYTQLKLTMGGARLGDSGSFTGIAVRGVYWSTTTTSDVANNVKTFSIGASLLRTQHIRSSGLHCKCIENK